jgi:hypothetical protein
MCFTKLSLVINLIYFEQPFSKTSLKESPLESIGKIKVIDKLVFCCPSSAQSKLGPLAVFATSLSNQLNLDIEIFYISVES